MAHVKIIAEAGVNHNGQMSLAKELIDVAKEAGADVVKFQTFCAKNLVTPQAKMADYQKTNMGQDAGKQLAMIQALELDKNANQELRDYCCQQKIEFLSTPFDKESVDLLVELGISTLKIPSGEVNNLPFLRHAINKFDHYIISTGMSDLDEIKWLLEFLYCHQIDKSQITLLHCNSDYPTKFTDVNLLAMRNLAQKFGVNVGYSDHTSGIEVPISAVALGATVIEKHFTLDRNLPGPDHKASLEPNELKSMVTSIRNIEQALGSPHKFVTESALKVAKVAKKSIVASCPIKKGEVFSEQNLTTKRPGTGLDPREWDNVIGKVATKFFLIDDLITL